MSHAACSKPADSDPHYTLDCEEPDTVQAGAGIELLARPGDRVRAGQPLLRLHTNTPEAFAAAREALSVAVTIGDRAPATRPLVVDRIG